jgi:formate/nitrite transporter FocA (FNT family)
VFLILLPITLFVLNEYSHVPHNIIAVYGEPCIQWCQEFLETLDKLIMEEKDLPVQILNMDETSLFWKQMPERTFIHKEAK